MKALRIESPPSEKHPWTTSTPKSRHLAAARKAALRSNSAPLHANTSSKVELKRIIYTIDE